MTSVFTHSEHIFRGLPFFSVPGIWKFVIDLIQDMARCTWPYHRRQQRTDVMSLVSSFCISEVEGASSLSLMPQIQQIMAWWLQQSCRSSGGFGPHVLLPWNTSKQTQATYILPHILAERCLEVRTGKSFWKQRHCHSPHRSTMYHKCSRKWLPNQAWCHRHPFQSQCGHQWAKTHTYT